MKNGNWDSYQLFLQVARLGGLTGAGIASGLSPATVGRRMLDLEQSLGRTLFSRSQTGYRLTADGQALLDHLQEMEAAARKVDAWRQSGGTGATVRIAADDERLAPQLRALELLHRGKEGVEVEVGDDHGRSVRGAPEHTYAFRDSCPIRTCPGDCPRLWLSGLGRRRLAAVPRLRRCIRLEAVEQLVRVGGDEQQLAVLLADEALRDRTVAKGEERLEVAADLEEADGLAVQAELRPGHHLEEFFQRAEAARQCQEAIAQFGHAGLPFVHCLHDQQPAQPMVRHFLDREEAG